MPTWRMLWGRARNWGAHELVAEASDGHDHDAGARLVRRAFRADQGQDPVGHSPLVRALADPRVFWTRMLDLGPHLLTTDMWLVHDELTVVQQDSDSNLGGPMRPPGQP